MKTKHLRKLTLMLIAAGLTIASQAAAFADDNSWLQSLFGTQTTNNQQTQTNSGNLSQDQSLVQGAAEAVNRTQQKMNQDNQALQQDYQKLQQDRRTGADTTADLQAIQAQKQAMRSDRTDYAGQMQGLRTYQNNVAQDQGLPAPVVANSGYIGPDGGRWDNRPQGYYNNGAWRQNTQYNNNGPWQQNTQYHHRENWNGHHRRYDSDNDNG